MTKIAINGLGRIGKLVMRAFEAEGAPGEIVLLNDLGADIAQHALLLEFDITGRQKSFYFVIPSFGNPGFESLF